MTKPAWLVTNPPIMPSDTPDSLIPYDEIVQEALRARLDQLFGPDHGYADLVPAMQKVVQAAGRVLRTPEDRGWLWLLDDRYRRPAVRRLLPAWWAVELTRGEWAGPT